MAEGRKGEAAAKERQAKGKDATPESNANGDGGVLRRLAVPFTVGVVVGAVTVGLRRSSAYLKENVLPKLEEADVEGIAAKGKQLAGDAKERVVDAGSAAASTAGDVVARVTGEDGDAGSVREDASAPRPDPEEREAARKEREARRAERRQRAAA